MDRLFIKIALSALLIVGAVLVESALPGWPRRARELCAGALGVLVLLGVLLTLRDVFGLWRAAPGYLEQLGARRRAARRARALAAAERELERARRGKA